MKQPELACIVAAFDAREIGIVEVAAQLRPLGCLMIGAAVSQEVHEPQPSLLSYDPDLGQWIDGCRVEGEAPRRLLRATAIGRCAMLCALLGDTNQPGQRSRMNDILTDKPSPHFGYVGHPDAQEGTHVYAIPEVIHAVRQRGETLKGAIDIVDGAQFTFLARGWWGDFVSEHPAPRLASLAVDGRDLPADIIAVTFDMHQPEQT